MNLSPTNSQVYATHVKPAAQTPMTLQLMTPFTSQFVSNHPWSWKKQHCKPPRAFQSTQQTFPLQTISSRILPIASSDISKLTTSQKIVSRSLTANVRPFPESHD